MCFLCETASRSAAIYNSLLTLLSLTKSECASETVAVLRKNKVGFWVIKGE
jgi:hypothetical protein